MASIHVSVTAEHIAAAGPPPEEPVPVHKYSDPVERAIADATGQEVMCDSDVRAGEMATIGQGRTTLVNNLPDEVTGWIERFYRSDPIEPFSFDIEIEDWLARLVGAPELLTIKEAAEVLGIKPVTLRSAVNQLFGGAASEGTLAGRLGMLRRGRDWFVPRDRLDAEIARRNGARLDDAIATGEI